MRKSIMLVIVLLLVAVTLPAQGQLISNDTIERDVIAGLNAWRLAESLWPLKPNATLDALALEQARYLAGLPELPKDLHIDKNGLQPRERALLAPFNWPYYTLPGQIAIGENAALGDVTYALRFWHESAIHARTVLNPAYREIGVAAVPYKRSYLFITVFGGRPDVLPALVDPHDGRTVYLSSDRFEYARLYDSIQQPATIQVFDRDGRPLYDAPQPWTPKLTVPVEAGDAVYILSSDGQHTVISPVDLQRDRAILPDEAPAPAATPVPLAAVPSATPAAAAQPGAAATVIPPAAAVEADLLVVYSKDTLDVLNVSSKAADWRALNLHGTIDFPFSQWSRVADFPLEALPNRHCLQIRSGAVRGDVIKPDNCGWVRSFIQVSADRVFWAQGPFEVRLNDVVLATCQPGVGVCAVDLP
jgi:uncharacterized protein YkwD